MAGRLWVRVMLRVIGRERGSGSFLSTVGVPDAGFRSKRALSGQLIVALKCVCLLRVHHRDFFFFFFLDYNKVNAN